MHRFPRVLYLHTLDLLNMIKAIALNYMYVVTSLWAFTGIPARLTASLSIQYGCLNIKVQQKILGQIRRFHEYPFHKAQF